MTVNTSNIQIEESWKVLLHKEFEKPYFGQIKEFLTTQKNNGKVIYPPGKQIFHAFNLCPLDKVKVVILGQDPYHGPLQAMGLCFGVNRGIMIPASLSNIYKELQRDLNIPPAKHGDLSSWAAQGVFLLNAVLTVEAGQAASHQKIGWQVFTDAVIQSLSQQKENLVFLLWGNFAKSKAPLIDTTKHVILESVHPSPLAGGKFIGCGHFSKTNEILNDRGITPIDWKIPD